ncbi:MAG: sigma 54-interacting transcriptional regulator, partial [Deltaproteobacteria bacterium]|nr:sigma 54-interacting transcriptional regulator [Deltaproteobacteria bacterium]
MEKIETAKGQGMASETPEADRGREEPLRASEERSRKIFEHSNDAIFVVDPERDEILDVNPVACRMLGYSRGELLSLPISEVHPDEMPELLAFARSVYERGSGWTDELTCLTKSGSRLPAEISASVIEIEGRICLIVMARDISARKRAEAMLQQHAAALERLVEERTAELSRSREQYRILLEVNNAIILSLTREALFQAIAQALRSVIDFDRGMLTLYNPEKDSFRVLALEGASLSDHLGAVGTDLSRQASIIIGRVLEERRPVLVGDLSRERRLPAEQALLGAGIRSIVVLPLIATGEVLGTLHLGSRTPDRYSEADAGFLQEVANQLALAVENMKAYEEIAHLKRRLQEENVYLREEIQTDYNFEELIGESRALKKVLRTVETVAPTDTTVLLLGETGTGKELVARAIHHLGRRKDRALVKVNCAALPSGLIESELFGHEKGAFTGALSRKIGRFELADGGTIFLDEIAEMSLELQSKLLRVLESGEVRRIGSGKN